jgi:hypothetical protein
MAARAIPEEHKIGTDIKETLLVFAGFLKIWAVEQVRIRAQIT